MSQIILVTGANKGIGFEVAKQLAVQGHRIFLGARNAERGSHATVALANAGDVTFLPLDVANADSVASAAAQFATIADRLDVLINNAGILLDGDSNLLTDPESLLRETLETNTFGPLRVTRAFLPHLKRSPAPRIINVSSGGGQLSDGAGGWAPAYCLSKTALNGVTSQLAGAFPEAAVNSVCPGWVRTDMGGASAARSVEQGADTIVWLATSAPHSLTGKFYRDQAEIPW